MGGKKDKGGTISADNLYNQDMLELGLGMCEGTIEGLENGLKTMYANKIPVESETGEYNFQDLGISFRQGYFDDQPVRYIMGGESSVITSSLGLSLPADVPRTITTPPQYRGKIKSIDVRLVIQQLFTGDGKNSSEASIIFQVKYRKVGDPNWRYVHETSESLTEYRRKVSTLKQAAADKGINYDLLSPEERYSFELTTLKELKNVVSADLENLEVDAALVAQEESQYFLTATGSGLRGMYRAVLFKRKYYLSLAQIYADQISGVTASELYNQMIIYKGKTTGGYIYELTIPIFDVDADQHDWEVQVVRRSRELNSEEKKYSGKVMSLDSISLTSEPEKKYTKTAVCQIVAQHTDRFSDIPDFSAVIKGLICDVPTNYNPVAKTWVGTWDGYFKKAWTDNNALIAHELIMNRDWGKRAAEPQIKVEAASLMEAIKYCDELVPDLTGALKPRHTFNDVISDDREIDEYLKYILGSFHATSRENFGVYRFFIDRKKEPTFFVTKETALQTGISYNRSDLSSRFNHMKVSFKNKENDYEEDRRVLLDEQSQLVNGLIPYSFQAIGATNLSEAIRQAVYLMYTNKEENTFATFSQPRLGHVVNLYDHFLIADRDMDWGTSARILSFDKTRGEIELRDPLVIATERTFKVYMHTHSGIKKVNAEASTPYTLVLTDPQDWSACAPYLSEDSPIILENQTYGSPKVFRVLSIAQSDSNDMAQGELFTFKAAVVSDLKYTAIDNINKPEFVNFKFNSADLTYDRKRVATVPRNVFLWLRENVNDIGQQSYGLKFTASKNAERYEVVWVNKTTQEKRETVIYDDEAILSPAFPEYTPLKLRITPFNSLGEAGDVFYMDDVILSMPSDLGLPTLVSIIYVEETKSLRFSFTKADFSLIPNQTTKYTQMVYSYSVPSFSGGNKPSTLDATYIDIPYAGAGTYQLQLKFLAPTATNDGYSSALTTVPWVYFGDDSGSLPVNKFPTPIIQSITSYKKPELGANEAPAGRVYVGLVIKIPDASSFPDYFMRESLYFFPFTIIVSDDANGIYRRIGYIGGTRVFGSSLADGLFYINMNLDSGSGNTGNLPDHTKVGAKIQVRVQNPSSLVFPEAPNWSTSPLDSDWAEVIVPPIAEEVIPPPVEPTP